MYSKMLLVLFLPIMVLAQFPKTKEVNQKTQSWYSINTVNKFSKHWGVVADAHIRVNYFAENVNFYFLRGGVCYTTSSSVFMAVGYAHMWLEPPKSSWSTYADEHRVYQQFQLPTKSGKVSILQRLRNEQRWQELIIDDKSSGNYRFTDRVRYLASFTIPIFQNKKIPSLVLSDEILINFGEAAIYNTFDQNRLFVGIMKDITPSLRFDFGYMNVYQQKITGNVYDVVHTLRLFFYLNNNLYKQGM